MSKSIKNPPILSEAKDYESFTKLLKIWQIATDLPKEKQGAALLLSLEGEAQSAALRVTEEELKSATGIDKVVAELNKLYTKDKTSEKIKALEDLENYKKTKNISMQQYILEFKTKLDKTKLLGIVWPDDIIAFRLLKNANLPEQDHRLAKATVGSLEYEKVKEKLSTIFGEMETESTASSSMKFEELNITDCLDDQENENYNEENIFYGNQYQNRSRFNNNQNRNQHNQRYDQQNQRYDQQNQRYDQYNQSNNNKHHNQNISNRNPSRQDSFPPLQQNRPPMSQFRSNGNTRQSQQARGRFSTNFQRRSPSNDPSPRNTNENQDSNLNARNPLDQNGQISRCSNCESINHWVSSCPDINRNNYIVENDEQTLFANSSVEDVTLFESDLDAGNLNGLVAETLDAAVIDCGASKTCCGSTWWDNYTSSLSEEEMEKIQYSPSNKTFKFGDGRKYQSLTAVMFPVSIGGKPAQITADIVSANIPLLLSRESLKKANTKINFSSDYAEILGEKVHLVTTKSGHYALPITMPRQLLQKAIQTNDYSNVKNIVHTVLQTSSSTMDVKKLAVKLHKQFAHPPSSRLTKLVNSAGEPWSSNEALKDAIKLVEGNCDICKLFKRPPPRPVVGLPMATKFLECIAMDLKHYNGNLLLHMIDYVTRHSFSCVIRSKKPEVIIEKMFMHLISPFGTVGEFFTDNGGEFANADFLNMCEALNIKVRVTAGESPWSNGLVERHNLIISEMLDSIMEDNNINIHIALAWALNAKNSLSNCHGFSPYQLSIGSNPKLPCAFSDLPPALTHKATSKIIKQNLDALHRAREAFIRAENSERIRRAARINIRHANVNTYTTGDTVYYKRNDNRKWHGPGVVIGRDGSQVLIKHGSYYVRVHTCRVISTTTRHERSEGTSRSNSTEESENGGNNQVQTRTTDRPTTRSRDQEDDSEDSDLEDQATESTHQVTQNQLPTAPEHQIQPCDRPMEASQAEGPHSPITSVRNSINSGEESERQPEASPQRVEADNANLSMENEAPRDRSMSDLCDRLAKSFNSEAGPGLPKLIDAVGGLSGKDGGVEGSKQNQRGGAGTFEPLWGNFQEGNRTKSRRHENTSHTSADNNLSQIANTETSDLGAIKKGSVVQFKGKDINDEWYECEILNRAGRATGKYPHSWNIMRDGALENIDFQRDVGDFRVINQKQPTSTTSIPLQSRDTEFTANQNEDIIDLCETYINLHDRETLLAKERELESWKREEVYTEVPNEGQSTMSTTWVVKPKVIDGKYSLKARLCARGFEEDQFFRTDSPTCSREGLRITLAAIASNGWTLRSMDVKTAFLQGNHMQRTLYLKPPTEAKTKNLWLLKKCVYGLSDASRQWYLRVKEEMTKLGGQMNKLDHGLFTFTVNGQLCGIIACFVDDMIYGAEDSFERFITESLKSVFQIGSENISSFNYVGLKVHQNSDRSITTDQRGYIASIQKLPLDSKLKPETILTSAEATQFRGLVGKLNWACGMTCPEISFEVCWASTVTRSPTIRDAQRLNKVVNYLKGAHNVVHFPRLDSKTIQVTTYSDASFNNLPNGGSQGGHLVFITDTNGNACPISWSSNKIKRVVRSSLAAETLSLADSISTGTFVTELLKDIFPMSATRPIKAISDSKSIYNNVSTSHRVSDKGVTVDMTFIREKIDGGNVCLEWVEGNDQLSDVLTKKNASPVALKKVLAQGFIKPIHSA